MRKAWYVRWCWRRIRCTSVATSDRWGSARQGLAAVHAGTGTLLPFVCNTNGAVLALAKSGNDLFVGGSSQQLQVTSHENLARVSASTGVPYTLPSMNSSNAVNVLRVVGGRLYAAGTFNSLNNIDRFHAGSFDLTTYGLTPWDPSVEIETAGVVNDLVISGDTILIGGQFDHVGGVKHYNMAAVHAVTGMVLDHPSVADNSVLCAGLLGSWLSDHRQLQFRGYSARQHRVYGPGHGCPITVGPTGHHQEWSIRRVLHRTARHLPCAVKDPASNSFNCVMSTGFTKC